MIPRNPSPAAPAPIPIGTTSYLQVRGTVVESPADDAVEVTGGMDWHLKVGAAAEDFYVSIKGRGTMRIGVDAIVNAAARGLGPAGAG